MTRSGRVGVGVSGILAASVVWAAPASPPSATSVWQSGPPPITEGQARPAASDDPQLAPPAVAPKQKDFEDALAEFGTWVNEPGLGPLWQPATAMVGTDFVPYVSGGAWQPTARGWTFHSEWSWGWAPFHYGRWFVHERYGWVWAPQTAWAPAWVEWRTGGSLVAWAPLGPAGHQAAFALGARGWTFASVDDLARPELAQNVRYPVKVGAAWEWREAPTWKGAGVSAAPEPVVVAGAAGERDPYAPLDWTPSKAPAVVASPTPADFKQGATLLIVPFEWYTLNSLASGRLAELLPGSATGPWSESGTYGVGGGFPGVIPGGGPYSGERPGGGPYFGGIPGGGPFPGVLPGGGPYSGEIPGGGPYFGTIPGGGPYGGGVPGGGPY